MAEHTITARRMYMAEACLDELGSISETLLKLSSEGPADSFAALAPDLLRRVEQLRSLLWECLDADGGGMSDADIAQALRLGEKALPRAGLRH